MLFNMSVSVLNLGALLLENHYQKRRNKDHTFRCADFGKSNELHTSFVKQYGGRGEGAPLRFGSG